MALPPHGNANGIVPEFIAQALARVGIDVYNQEHREKFTAFMQWSWKEYTDAIKHEQERELLERERRARMWTIGISVLTCLIGAVATILVKKFS